MKRGYGEITKDILLTLALVGVIAIASTSPYFWVNIIRGIVKYKKYSKNKVKENNLYKSLRRLKDNRLVILKKDNGKFIMELTEKGKRKVEEIQFENMEIKKLKIWDQKWRVIIFDIPDRQKRRARNALREKLQKLGFYQLQKSVWVYPYSCEKEIQFLCQFFNINPFVNIIVAEKIYDNIKLKKHFGIK